MPTEVASRIPLFNDLPADTLQHISALLKCRAFSRGEVLFTEGDSGEGVWILNVGSVKLIKSDAEGREQLLKIVKPNEVFSEVVLFDGGSYPATAMAAENGCAFVLYNRDAKVLIEQNPSLAWHFLGILSRRLRSAQERLRIVSAADVSVKLAGLLVHLKEDQQTSVFTVSQQDLANMLGSARETVSRSLSLLAAEGLIGLSRNRVEVLDEKALEEIARR